MAKVKIVQMMVASNTDSADWQYLDDKGRVWFDNGHNKRIGETPSYEWIPKWEQIDLPEEPRSLSDNESSKFDPYSLENGLYTIYWKSGGTSIAAVGRDRNGDPWLAPTNWLTASTTGWGEVDRAVIVEVA